MFAVRPLFFFEGGGRRAGKNVYDFLKRARLGEI